jgi:transaldolase
MDPLRDLEALGQSIWLDELDRELLSPGVRGMRWSSSRLGRSIAGSSAFDARIAGARSPEHALETIQIAEAKAACDALRSIHEATGGADGFVAIDVDPALAEDVGAMVEHAVRLWTAIDRPNVMLAIPATRPGLVAIRSCLEHGLNVDATTVLSVTRWREVVEEHFQALEKRAAGGMRVDRVASVASFPLAAVDAAVDRKLDALPNALRGAAGLRGQIAIAIAKLAFDEQARLLATDRWRALADRGARPQRLLWAHPTRDQIEALVGAGTVVAMTEDALHEYAERGRPAARLGEGLENARRDLRELVTAGVDLDDVLSHLEDECLRRQCEERRAALDAITDRRRALAA